MTKPEMEKNLKQYSAPAEKAAFCTSTNADSNCSSNCSSNSSYATSNTNGHGNDTKDSINALYQLYNIIKDANQSFCSQNDFNTIMVKAHLEYKDCFAGLSHNQCDCYIICNNGADTWVIGNGWTILDEDPIQTTNLVTFDPKKMCKMVAPS